MKRIRPKRGHVPDARPDGDAPRPPLAPEHAAQAPLWLALHLPALALEALADRPAESPCVVVEEHGTRAPVCGVCPRAYAGGARVGMSAGAAAALVPGLVVRARSVVAERAVLARVLRLAGRFSSVTAPTGSDTVWVEVAGSAGLFGGIEVLCAALTSAVARRGLTVQHALAPTPTAARVLAALAPGTQVMRRSALAGVLAGLPVTALDLPERACADLRAMGVTTLGAVARLPRAGLAQRFTPDSVRMLDRLYGRVADPVVAHRPPARFRRTLELPAAVAHADMLRAACAQLLQALCAVLIRRGDGVQALAVRLHTHGASRRAPEADADIRLTLAAPTQDPAHLTHLLGERLDRLTLSAPVQAITLRTHTLVTLTPADAPGLFGPAAGEQWQRLAERLHARLGAGAVHGLAQHADHRPEHAWRTCPPGQTGPALPGQPHAPLWLLARPRRLAVRDDGPWLDGPLTLITPPWRIEAGWWSGADVRRDYHAARDTAGRCWWVYRTQRSGRWYLHGRYH